MCFSAIFQCAGLMAGTWFRHCAKCFFFFWWWKKWLSESGDFFHLVWALNCEVHITSGGVFNHLGPSAKWRAVTWWQISPQGDYTVVGKRGTSQTPGNIWSLRVGWFSRISDGSLFLFDHWSCLTNRLLTKLTVKHLQCSLCKFTQIRKYH